MAIKSKSPINTIQYCTFTAEAGNCQSPEVTNVASRLADALVAQAKAVSDLAFMLKGTNAGVMQTGINLEGAK